MDATTVAVDLAKDIFEGALANRAGRIVERKRLTRRQFERFLDGLPADTEVIMEACGTAHYWGRRCQARGLRPRLLPVQYVRPYVRRNKTDRTDTEAMLEAARCGDIRPVPVKTVEQQTLQALHRVRTQWQAARTARINVVRGLLREQGLPVPVGVGAVGHIHAFRRGREFASWLGLTPRESSTGGRRSLGRISKRGDVYLRCLLTHGARSVLLSAQRTSRATPQRLTRLQAWAVATAARRGHNKAAIAVANKLARIIWVIWHKEVDFQSPAVTEAA